MPYKDPEKAKQTAKARAQKSRANRKLRELQGLETGSSPPPTGPGGRPGAQSVAGQLTVDLVGDIPTPAEFALIKVKMGLQWMEKSQELLGKAPAVAYNMGRAGIDLVNANLNFVSMERNDGPQPGSVAALDGEFIKDPEYLRLAEALLARKCDLQTLREQQARNAQDERGFQAF